MAKKDHFQEDMQRMTLPEGLGGINVRGFQLEPDEDDCVNVPVDAVQEVTPHGLVETDPTHSREDKNMNTLLRRRFLGACAAGVACSVAGFDRQARAQAIAKSTRIVVGSSVGGVHDVVARLIADRIRGQYAPTVIVENRTGASGRIAVDYVKGSEPDGSSILLAHASSMVIFPHVYKKLTYDPLRDFTPVSAISVFHHTLTVGPAVPAGVKTVAEFVQWCRANPKQAAYATPAAGDMTHFIGVMLARAAGIELTNVPYKGAAPAMLDLLGGQIPAAIISIGTALPYVKAGKLRVLATSGPTRSRYLPQVLSFKESGYKDIEVQDWNGVFVPLKTPPDTVAKLNVAINNALKSDAIAEGFAKLGVEAAIETPASFAAMVKAEYDRWGPIVKASGFSLDD